MTGGSSGLGLAVVQELLKEGIAKVIILDIAYPPQILLERAKYRVEYLNCDIANGYKLYRVLKQVFLRCKKNHQYISICVLSAGLRNSGSLLSLDSDQINQAFNVNTFSQIWIQKALIESYLQDIHRRRRPKLYIVSIASILGVLAPKNLSLYSATKAAVIQVHEALASELSHIPSIRLLLVATGQLSTRMFDDVKPPKPFFAPLVDHLELAKKIVIKINRGEKGVLCEPFYANFLPLVKCLPIVLQDLCRFFSGIDNSIIESHSDNSK